MQQCDNDSPGRSQLMIAKLGSISLAEQPYNSVPILGTNYEFSPTEGHSHSIQTILSSMILNFASSLKPAIQSSSCLFNDGIFNILFYFIQFKYLRTVSVFPV